MSKSKEPIEILVAVRKGHEAIVFHAPEDFWSNADGVYTEDCSVRLVPKETGVYALKLEWWGDYDYESGHYDDWGYTVLSYQTIDLCSAVRGPVTEGSEE